MRWHITAQQEVNGQDSTGKWGPGVQVSFVLDNGQGGTVFVPQSQYNAANVTTAINGWAATLSEVAGLTGTV